MYAFPQISIPKRAIKHARDNKMEPDAFYCFVRLKIVFLIKIYSNHFILKYRNSWRKLEFALCQALGSINDQRPSIFEPLSCHQLIKLKFF